MAQIHKLNNYLRLGWFRVRTQEAIPRSAVVADQYPSVRFVRRSPSLVDIGIGGREIEPFEIVSH